MLPDGFEINGCRGTYRLTFSGQVIALSSELDDGCRVCLHAGNARQMRHVFLDSPWRGVEYMERWAMKWERELRELYGPGSSRRSRPYSGT